MLQLKFPVSLSTAPLYVVHYNTVHFFFPSLELLTHSLHGMNAAHFRVSYSMIFFLSLIAHCMADCHLSCTVFKLCYEEELLTFMCSFVAHVTL